MISGLVNSSLEPIIVLTIIGPYVEAKGIEALVDTGFSSYLTLPPEIVVTLDLGVIGVEQAIMADGTEIPSELYMARSFGMGASAQLK